MFMPGETLVLAGGFLAGKAVFDLDVSIVTVSIARSASFRKKIPFGPAEVLAGAQNCSAWPQLFLKKP